MAQTGKLLYDVTMTRVAEQRDSHSAMVGRAKDLLGTTAISSAIGATAAVRATTNNPPGWWSWLMVAAVAIQVAAALYVLRPKKFQFSPEPGPLRERLAERAAKAIDDGDDAWFAALAAGFLDVDSRGQSAIDRNAAQIKRCASAVLAQIVSLAATLVLSIVLLIVN